MELRAILNTTAVRVIKEAEPPRVFLPDIARAVAEKYSFVKYPKTIEDFSGQFLEFAFGNFFNEVAVAKLQIYNGGLMAEAAVHSKELDRFLDDVMKTLTDFGTTISPDKMIIVYGSTLEIKMKAGFASWFDRLDPIVATIRSVVEKAGIGVSDYEVGGFTIVGDGPDPLKPPRFVLERRANETLEDNIFYSQGPLSTDEHIKLLEQAESLF